MEHRLNARNRTITTIVFIAVATILVVPSVQAQTAAVQTEARCKIAKTNLAERLAVIEKTRSAHASVHSDIQAKVDSLITSATTKEYNQISALTTAQASVQKNIDTYSAKVVAYTNTLKTASTIDCSKALATLDPAIKAARTSLTETNTAAATVRKSITEQTIPAIKAYAAWLATQNTTPTTGTTE